MTTETIETIDLAVPDLRRLVDECPAVAKARAAALAEFAKVRATLDRAAAAVARHAELRAERDEVLARVADGDPAATRRDAEIVAELRRVEEEIGSFRRAAIVVGAGRANAAARAYRTAQYDAAAEVEVRVVAAEHEKLEAAERRLVDARRRIREAMERLSEELAKVAAVTRAGGGYGVRDAFTGSVTEVLDSILVHREPSQETSLAGLDALLHLEEIAAEAHNPSALRLRYHAMSGGIDAERCEFRPEVIARIGAILKESNDKVRAAERAAKDRDAERAAALPVRDPDKVEVQYVHVGTPQAGVLPVQR